METETLKYNHELLLKSWFRKAHSNTLNTFFHKISTVTVILLPRHNCSTNLVYLNFKSTNCANNSPLTMSIVGFKAVGSKPFLRQRKSSVAGIP